MNQDPRRGVGHEKVLTRLELDAQALKMLEKVDMTPESVPVPGQIVYLRSTANLSTGGTATDVVGVVRRRLDDDLDTPGAFAAVDDAVAAGGSGASVAAAADLLGIVL